MLIISNQDEKCVGDRIRVLINSLEKIKQIKKNPY